METDTREGFDCTGIQKYVLIGTKDGFRHDKRLSGRSKHDVVEMKS